MDIMWAAHDGAEMVVRTHTRFVIVLMSLHMHAVLYPAFTYDET